MVSIIVPIFNVKKYLHQCIESILLQSYKNFELLLVDDGSTDGSETICDQYALQDNRITVIHKKNGGLSSARNAGLDVAKGNYIAFVDSDDFIAPQYISLMLNAVKASGSEIAVCEVQLTNDTGIRQPKYFRIDLDSAVENGQKAVQRLCGKNLTTYEIAWNKLYAAHLWEKLRYPLRKLHEDVFVSHELLYSASSIVGVPEILYFYRQRNDSIIHTISTSDGGDRAEAYYMKYLFFKAKALPLENQRMLAHIFWIYEKEFCYALLMQLNNENKKRLRQELKKVRVVFWNLITYPQSLLERITILCFAISPCITYHISKSYR